MPTRKAKQQNSASEYVQVVNPQGYINNQEITNLPEQYLIKGSLNMLIKNAQKVMSRKGYILKGAGKTENHGIHSWYDAMVVGGVKNLRVWNKTMEVWAYDAWQTVTTTLSGKKTRFTTWWNATELLDVILFVDGGDYVKEWSGGIAKVAGTTTSTITKQGYLSGTNISFSNNGAAPDSILRASGGFLNAGFAAGDTIVVQGSGSNDGEYVIASVTDGSLVLSADDELTTEAAGASVVVKWPLGGTWAEARFFTTNAGDDSDRKVVIKGIPYAYTGGEDTGTLTGVTPDPNAQTSVPAVGDVVTQAVRTYTPSEFSGFSVDLIAMQNNYVFYGSSRSREVLFATQDDFSDFSYTTPLRKPGEGFTLTLDSVPTAFAPAADQQQINRSGLISIFAGTDDQYTITFTLSSDNTYEKVDIIHQKTGSGLAARSQECITTIRNAILFLTFEPTLEQLGHVPQGVDTPRSVPLSDPIRDDLEEYDLEGASMLYDTRSLYIALPKAARYLIRDFQNNYWQPPQTGAFSGFARIDGKLCAHSAYTNETYQLNTGYNDNGAPIDFVAEYGYDNYGSRFSLKSFNEHATELYMSKNTVVTKTINYEYKGAAGSRSFSINGAKESINFIPKQNASIGQNKLGSKPIGSSDVPLSETTDGYSGMGKCRIIQSTTLFDFFERNVRFSASGLDARFHILAFGENVEMSDNIPTFIKDQ